MQAEFAVDGFEGFAGQQQAQILLADQHVHAHAGQGDGKGGAAGADKKALHGGQQCRHHAESKQQSAQTQCQYHHGLGEKHAFQAAARYQLGNVFGNAVDREAGEEPAAQLLE